jgi:hypothetical protein
LVKATEDAIAASGKKIPLKKIKVGIRGEIKSEEQAEAAHQARQFAHPH